TSYTAVGYLNVSTTSLTTAQHEAFIASPANLNTAAAVLRNVGGWGPFPPAASIAPDLKVSAVPQTRLIAVSYSNDDPRIAANVAQVVMASYANSTPGVAIAATAP